jgi:5,10-methylenetetrahydrofolate reductase
MRFAEVVNQKKFSLVVQMDPPKGSGLVALLNTALALRGLVDAVSFTDNAMAIMRMNPIAPCHLLLQHNMEPILHINARDRNRLSFQAELLAAWALDIRSVLLREGEDPSYGDHPLALPCKDLTLERMCEVFPAFREGKDLSGLPLQTSPSFHVGVGIALTDDTNANRQKAADLPRLARLGVHFVFLGTTYDVDTIQLFSKAAAGTGIKVFASILMLKSVGMAKYLNSIPGMPKVPGGLIARIANAPLKQKACLEIAADFMKALEYVCDGAVIVPLGWETKVPELLDLYNR